MKEEMKGEVKKKSSKTNVWRCEQINDKVKILEGKKLYLFKCNILVNDNINLKVCLFVQFIIMYVDI